MRKPKPQERETRVDCWLSEDLTDGCHTMSQWEVDVDETCGCKENSIVQLGTAHEGGYVVLYDEPQR